MAERTARATERAVAGQRWQTQRSVADESVTQGFGLQQELEAEAQAIASGRASVQTLEACEPACFQPFKPAQPAKIVMQNPKALV